MLLTLVLTLLAVSQQTSRAPDQFRVRFDTTRGPIIIEIHREWAPHAADRFHALVASGYYDDSPFFRVIKDKWVQFGISGKPALSQQWRTKTMPDDPWHGVSNRRGTVAFAFKDPAARTTQVFINLRDNSETHDKEPFVVFGTVVEGMDVADTLYSEYGESSGGGIRAGHQDRLFAEGNAYLRKEFPKLDYIVTARIEQ